jgi:broad specificity phosphatase PhoE/ribonuclease HI
MAAHNVIVEADGGSRGNPGPAGYGALLRDADTGEVLADTAEFIGHATNNVAEYRGLISGLELYQQHTPDALLEVRMDSKLVIEQMAGRWKIKHPDMRPLAIEAQRLAPFGTVWTWVPRDQNQAADRLANVAMDAAMGRAIPDSARADRGSSRPHGDPTPDPDEPPAPGTGLRNPMLGWSGMLGQATTLVFLRHGETVHTKDKKFSGPGGDDPGLTDEGWAQARRAASALADDDEPFDALVCSPMRRTRETASAIADLVGLDIEIENGFREAAFGDWDGLTLEQVAEKWPAELDAWLGSFEVAPPGGGESIVEVRARVEAALSGVLERYAGKRMIVVSHVNPIKLSVRYCLDAPLDAVNKMLLAPASLTTLSFFESGASALRQFSAIP